MLSGKNRHFYANASRFLEITIFLQCKTSDFSIKKANLTTIEKPKNAKNEKNEKIVDFSNVSPVLKPDKCFSNNTSNEILLNDKSFYKWVPPHMKELKFDEMKNYEDYVNFKEKSLNSSDIRLNQSNFSFTPPKMKDYLKKSKSQIMMKHHINKSLIENPKIPIKNENNQETAFMEMKEELKKTRQCNNQYLKKNQELEIKFFEISKAFEKIMNIFEKTIDFSKNLIKESPLEEYKEKWNNYLERLEGEKRKIDGYLKFKSIFAYRFSELVDNFCRKNLKEYEISFESIFFLIKDFLLKFIYLRSSKRNEQFSTTKNKLQVNLDFYLQN